MIRISYFDHFHTYAKLEYKYFKLIKFIILEIFQLDMYVVMVRISYFDHFHTYAKLEPNIKVEFLQVGI